LQINPGIILANLAQFRSKEGLWASDVVWSSAAHIPPGTWWKGVCQDEPLAQLAVRLLTVPPTSAAAERNWSAFGNVHTARRNRLTNDKVEKLVAIRCNLQLRKPNNTAIVHGDSDDSSASDSE
jgi:hypothetical protein